MLTQPNSLDQTVQAVVLSVVVLHPANIFRVEHWGLNSLLKVGTSADAAVYHAVVFGKIADATHGTVVRANGNHYEGGLEDAFKPVSDKNAPPHVLILKTPTDAPDKLTNKFFDQIAFARELENVESHRQKIWKRVLCSSMSTSDHQDLLVIVTGKIYGTPSNTENAAGAASTPQAREENLQSLRVRRRQDSSPEPVVVEERETNEFKYKSGDRTDFELPLDREIRIGAGYDPRVYYDFNGPLYFMLKSAMATQLNICDHNKALIPPWKLYNAFRPGALIMAIVQVSTFGFTERSRVRKTFQLEAKQIWVYDEGDGPVAIRRPPVPRNPTDFSPAMSTPYTPQQGMTDLFSTGHQTPGSPPVFSALILGAVAALAYDPTCSENVSGLLSYRILLPRDQVPRVVPPEAPPEPTTPVVGAISAIGDTPKTLVLDSRRFTDWFTAARHHIKAAVLGLRSV
ncbi:hypothetical protein DFH08DRAFT_966888 [Mycena albidolilacea]|uniref:Uncharacterized protein n=1 Tax=Mycena albidolilacea TaxID=1033008 RepID=A0AAD6ZNB4_9AGAR|nr:hypothetical protein DFH08DRAFT_966888 [Mycena albidolilacea]